MTRSGPPRRRPGRGRGDGHSRRLISSSRTTRRRQTWWGRRRPEGRKRTCRSRTRSWATRQAGTAAAALSGDDRSRAPPLPIGLRRTGRGRSAIRAGSVRHRLGLHHGWHHRARRVGRRRSGGAASNQQPRPSLLPTSGPRPRRPVWPSWSPSATRPAGAPASSRASLPPCRPFWTKPRCRTTTTPGRTSTSGQPTTTRPCHRQPPFGGSSLAPSTALVRADRYLGGSRE